MKVLCIFHSTPFQAKANFGTAKMRGKAHWANGTAVEEHEHVVIKLASDSDSSADTDNLWPEGLRNFTFLNSNI